MTAYPRVTFRTGTADAAVHLVAAYGWERARADRVLSIATTFGIKCEATEGGYVQVERKRSHSWPDGGFFTIEDHTGRVPPETGEG